MFRPKVCCPFPRKFQNDPCCSQESIAALGQREFLHLLCSDQQKSQHSGFSSIISIQNEASFLKFETSTEYILHVAQQIDLPFHDSLTMYKIVHCMLRNKSNHQCRVMSHSPKCTLFLALQLQRSWDAAPRALGEPRARSRTRTLECNITEHA